jgi:hypothetical protein
MRALERDFAPLIVAAAREISETLPPSLHQPRFSRLDSTSGRHETTRTPLRNREAYVSSDGCIGRRTMMVIRAHRG